MMRALCSALVALALLLLSPTTSADNGEGVAAGSALVALGGLGLVAGVVVLATLDETRDLAIGTMATSGAFVAVGSIVLATSIDRSVSVGVSDRLQLRVTF